MDYLLWILWLSCPIVVVQVNKTRTTRNSMFRSSARGHRIATPGISSDSQLAVPAWLIGNTLVSINKVTVRLTRLVLGWVTVYKRVNHPGM